MLTGKFGWEQEQTIRAISALQSSVTVIEPPRLAEVIEDSPHNNGVLECAAVADSDYLITSDRRHLLRLGEHRNTGIVNAPRFLSLLAQPP